MEELKNTIKQAINFIKKYWFLFAMGASIILLIIMRASVSSDSKTEELLKKSGEVKKKNQEKIKEAEKVITEAKKANEEIKASKAERAKSKADRDAQANDIFNVGDNDG